MAKIVAGPFDVYRYHAATPHPAGLVGCSTVAADRLEEIKGWAAARAHLSLEVCRLQQVAPRLLSMQHALKGAERTTLCARAADSRWQASDVDGALGWRRVDGAVFAMRDMHAVGVANGNEESKARSRWHHALTCTRRFTAAGQGLHPAAAVLARGCATPWRRRWPRRLQPAPRGRPGPWGRPLPLQWQC